MTRPDHSEALRRTLGEIAAEVDVASRPTVVGRRTRPVRVFDATIGRVGAMGWHVGGFVAGAIALAGLFGYTALTETPQIAGFLLIMLGFVAACIVSGMAGRTVLIEERLRDENRRLKEIISGSIAALEALEAADPNQTVAIPVGANDETVFTGIADLMREADDA